MRRFLAILLFILFMLFPSSLFASEQFAENYSVQYLVSEEGETTVSERVLIRNLSDQYFGTNYTTSIPSTQVYEVSARDSYRLLKTEVKKEGQRTVIVVSFPEQIIGKDKEYRWTLSYKTKDFAQRQGEVWQFSVPKISEIKNLESYDVTVSIPTVFGDPAKAVPNPVSDREQGSTIDYFFTRDQMTESGISMYFGKQQDFDFELQYEIENSGLLPIVKSVLVPGPGQFQEIIIHSIDPRPENVLFDSNHNSVAFFNLKSKERLKITVSGSAKLDLDRQLTELPEVDKLQNYLLPTPIWDSDSPQVQRALQIAFEGKSNLTTEEKIRHIYGYVTRALEFGNYEQTAVFPSNSASSVLNDAKGRFCQDFVNVFISLARAAQLPTQQVVGMAYTQNNLLRPTCYKDKELHTWVRVYDLQKGWVTVDPTWGATTSGGDFFSYSDLSHIQIGVLSGLPQDNQLQFPIKKNVVFSPQEFIPNFQLTPKILGSNQVIAGFPFTLTFRIENGGNTTLPSGSIVFNGGRLQFSAKNTVFSEQEYYYPPIPPFGFIDFEVHAKSKLAWDSYTDTVTLTASEQKVSRDVSVQPIFHHALFSVIVFGITFGMFFLYILALVLHYKSPMEMVVKEVKEVEKSIATVSKKTKGQKKRKMKKKKRI